jgi:hypothetical protein
VAGRRCRQRIPLGSHARRLRNCAALPRKVENEEADLSKLIDDALVVAEEVVWAVDQPGGSAALLLALCYGNAIRKSSTSQASAWSGLATPTAGSPKPMPAMPTSIADQARMRPDLSELKPGEQEIAELQLLLARRRDLITDQSRAVTRLREALVSLFPALERALWI